MKQLLVVLFLIASFHTALPQSANVPLNEDYYHLLDRYEIKQRAFSTDFFSNFKPYARQAIAGFLDSLPENVVTSEVDEFNLNYLRNDNWEFTNSEDRFSKKPLLKKLYRYQNDLFAHNSESFDVHFSPVFQFAVGQDDNSGSTPFINTRGAEIRGVIDQKVAFYTYLGENQAVFPGYVQRWNERYQVVPGEGFWKRYNDHGFDYFSVRGYINFNATKHIGLQLGYDKNIIGSGQRSMLLSDFSSSYPFLKINAQVWKLQYQVMYSQLVADQFFVPDGSGSLGTREYPKKFMTMHQLSINISDNFTLGFFESIIFNKEDSLGNSRFELNYLNPLIFYTAIEQQSGSADNVVLGVDARWNIAGSYQLYGQFLFDEFVVSEVFSGDGWWSNKYGFQLGGKYIDVLNIPNLDLQVEYNFSRPYNYTHFDLQTSFTNYRQPLAHALGANFKEFIAVLRYQPINRLSLMGRLVSANYGEDNPGENWGKNILLPYTTFEQEFDNVTGQGVPTDLLLTQLVASYQWKHNLFTDLTFTYRNEENTLLTGTEPTSFVQFAVRLNAPRINHLF
ncbi:MAG: hypothetical protein AAGC88_14010 [Bacteroidota bacterium]